MSPLALLGFLFLAAIVVAIWGGVIFGMAALYKFWKDEINK